MNEQQYARQARRADGRRRVSLVTRLVAGGAAAVAVLLGVVFAQESSGDTGTSRSSTDSGSSSDQGSSTDSGTGSGTDSGTWQAPGSSSGDSGSAHGSTGGS